MAMDLAGSADIVINMRMAHQFLRLRLYRPLYRRMTRAGRLDIPASHTQFIPFVIPAQILDQAVDGEGVIFAVHDLEGDELALRVTGDGAGSFSFAGNWAAILWNFNIRKNAVLSLWFFLSISGVPTLVLRPDGYRKPFQRVPPLPRGLGAQHPTPVFKGTANRFINFITSYL